MRVGRAGHDSDFLQHTVPGSAGLSAQVASPKLKVLLLAGTPKAVLEAPPKLKVLLLAGAPKAVLEAPPKLKAPTLAPKVGAALPPKLNPPELAPNAGVLLPKMKPAELAGPSAGVLLAPKGLGELCRQTSVLSTAWCCPCTKNALHGTVDMCSIWHCALQCVREAQVGLTAPKP